MATDQQEHAKIEQLVHANPDELEHAAGRERENLEGWIPALATDAEIRDALEKAFDYRGDITVTLRDGSQVQGYLFDRRTGATLAQSSLRMIPTGQSTRVSIAYADVAALSFSGRDTAAGKTFEAWVRKYWEKKAAGEKNIQIEPGAAGVGYPLEWTGGDLMATHSVLNPHEPQAGNQIDGKKLATEMRSAMAEERRRLGLPSIEEEIASWVWEPNDRWRHLKGILSDHPEHDTSAARAAERAWEMEHDERKFGLVSERS